MSATRRKQSFDSTSNIQTQLQITYEPDDMIDDLIAEREKAINKISGEMEDVNALFKQMHTMVLEQGEKIDSIATNIQKSTDNVEVAKKEIIKADENSKKSCSIL